MKNVGIQWIDPIPNHWEVRKIGQMYKERRTKVSDIDYPPLSVTMKGIVPQLATAAKTDAHDDRKLVKKGDFAINSRSDRRGSCGIAQQDGSVSLINTVLCPKKETNPEYLNWLFHTSLFADEFYRWGHGIVDDLWTTNWSDMKRIVIPFPSLPEQSRIATFLDERCGKIDETIAKHKALIEKLDEYRKAVITKAVTKGVRGERDMKESEIPWLHSIPFEWETTRFKFIGRTSHGFSYKPTDVCGEEGCLVIRASNIQNDEFVFNDNVYVNEAPEHLRIKAGDIIICATNGSLALVGKSAVATTNMDCVFGSFMLRYRTKKNPAYIQYLLTAVIPMHRALFATTTINQITMSMFNNMMIPNPSSEEQSEIVAYLDKKCAAIDAAKERHAQLMTKLEEYKKSLIYNAVTGKIEC